jgi:hypothetical protein
MGRKRLDLSGDAQFGAATAGVDVMDDAVRPLFVIYVLWHSQFARGAELAEEIRCHFRRQLYENVAGGNGLSVIFRSVLPPGADVPLDIDLEEARSTAVVVLTDAHLAADASWKAYIQQIADQTNAIGLHTRTFPVSIDHQAVIELGFEEQSFRWALWEGDDQQKRRRLLSELTYECCRMLRHLHASLKYPDEDETALETYLKKVQIFLSHSKHDSVGTKVAGAIRKHLHDGTGLTSFFDVHDIPAGLRIERVLLEQVKVSAVVAVHTDSYSSREWCRREIIEAKRITSPLWSRTQFTNATSAAFPTWEMFPWSALTLTACPESTS